MENIEKTLIKLKSISKIMECFAAFCNLFDDEINLREEIFNHYNLPGRDEYDELIYEYIDDEISLIELNIALQNASIQYLSLGTLSLENILLLVQDGKLKKLDAAQEIGNTYDYTTFILEKLEEGANLKSVLNDILILEKNKNLSEKIYLLKNIANPSQVYLYREINSLGLCFLDDYLEISTYKDVSIIRDFQIREIIFDKYASVSILCFTDDEDFKGLFNLEISLTELLEILMREGLDTSLLIDMMKRLGEKPKGFYELNFKDIYGKFISIENKSLFVDAIEMLYENFNDKMYAKKYKFIQLV